MNKLYDRNGKQIRIGMKLKRVYGSHGILDTGDTCIVSFMNDRSIKIEGDKTHSYDPKYFEVLSISKNYQPSWL